MYVIKPKYSYAVKWNGEAGVWEITMFRVEAAHRNKGVGTKAMKELLTKYSGTEM